MQAGTSAFKKACYRPGKAIEFNPYGPVLYGLAALLGKDAVNQRRLAVLDGVAKNGVLISFTHQFTLSDSSMLPCLYPACASQSLSLR